MADITTELAGLTNRIIAYRIYRRIGGQEMNRLAEKLAKASGVAGRISTKIEARADSLIAREGALEERTEQVFSPHEGILADAEKGLDEVEASLRLMSNGAPLELSSDSPASPPPVRALDPGMVIDGLTVVDHSKPAPTPIIGDQRKFDRMGG